MDRIDGPSDLDAGAENSTLTPKEKYDRAKGLRSIKGATGTDKVRKPGAQLSAPEKIQALENELQAMKLINAQVVSANQLLAKLLHGHFTRDFEILHVGGPSAELMVIRIDDGKDIRDDVIENLGNLMKIPVLVLPKSTGIDMLDKEALDKAGLTRKVVLTDANASL